MNDWMSKIRKRYFLYASMLLCSLVLKACSSDDVPEVEEPPVQEEEPVRPLDEVKVVMMSAESIFSGNGDSRVSFTLEDDRLKFAWAEGDKIAVCPSSGTQIAFSIKSGAGENSAKFDGGDWALRTTGSYAAYYPYNKENATNENRAEIPFSYVGQVQQGNGSLEHLSAYDLMATNATQADGDQLNFQFKHLNSVAQLRLTLPEDVVTEFKSLTIRCDEEVLAKTANLDLSGETYVWSVSESTNELRMSLLNIETTEVNRNLLLYMMLPPTDLAGKTVFAVLQGKNNRVYQAQLASRTMRAGYAYSFDATMVDVTVSQMIASPNFGESDVVIK